HGFENLGGIPVHARGDDHDGARVAGHDPPGRLDAVHFGHDEVHEDEIGRVLGAPFDGFGAVAGDPGQFVAARVRQHAPHGLDGNHHVINDGYPHVSASPIKSNTACKSVSS